MLLTVYDISIIIQSKGFSTSSGFITTSLPFLGAKPLLACSHPLLYYYNRIFPYYGNLGSSVLSNTTAVNGSMKQIFEYSGGSAKHSKNQSPREKGRGHYLPLPLFFASKQKK